MLQVTVGQEEHPNPQRPKGAVERGSVAVDQELRYQLDLDGVDKDALPMVIDMVDAFDVGEC